jgi:hypothetical protein
LVFIVLGDSSGNQGVDVDREARARVLCAGSVGSCCEFCGMLRRQTILQSLQLVGMFLGNIFRNRSLGGTLLHFALRLSDGGGYCSRLGFIRLLLGFHEFACPGK